MGRMVPLPNAMRPCSTPAHRQLYGEPLDYMAEHGREMPSACFQSPSHILNHAQPLPVLNVYSNAELSDEVLARR